MNGIVMLVMAQPLGASLSKGKSRLTYQAQQSRPPSTVLRKMEDEVPQKMRKILKVEPVNKKRDCETSARFAPAMKLGMTLLTESESLPYAATTTTAKMESAKARKRQARHGGGSSCESFAGLPLRRAGQSRRYESHSAKYQAE